ncbi:CAP domain-containing protein [Streptomyces sp. NPDC048479]|uniref:CAP domain-containing protein n=1 Tax=Streptomyces sp. NPDC048479 TaxID=3154725 RepID=UPI00343A10AC
MSKHRRKTYYRKITIAAVAVGAIGVPSAAMACMNPQENAGSKSYGHHWNGHHWKSANSEQRWTGAPWGQKPAAGASQTPAATPSAPKTSATPSAPKATATPSAPKTAAPASGDAARVLQLVNSERGKVGCSALTMNAKLTKAAQDHSKDMASHKNMSHTGSDGSSPGDRITSAGYNWSTYGENVAYGYATPESVMAGWMASPGHKANILNCAFKEIGIGLAQPNSYWTQDFGTAQ